VAQRSASAELDAQGSEQQPPARGPEHEQLDRFVGTWSVEGWNRSDAPVAADTKVTGEESYEWLPGQFFLVYRWDRQFGGSEHTGVGVIGRAESGDGYDAHFFDNLGYARTYEVAVRDGVLTLTGQWERATVTVDDGGDRMSIHWERSSDGRRWVPLCDLTGERAG
jgi:hypothetical protein